MTTGELIREGARRLDEAIEAKDLGSVLNCFAEDCEVELLGVTLKGREGVRRWMGWLFEHVRSISFEPRVITVEGEEFFEEFVVDATMHNGYRVRSHQSEVLTYRNGLVTSLRLYFNPLDFASATGITGRAAARLLMGVIRKGLGRNEGIR